MEKISDVSIPPFLSWRRRLGLSRSDVAKILNRTERQLQNYDQARELPQMLLLAMAAIEFLPSWRLNDLGIAPTWRR